MKVLITGSRDASPRLIAAAQRLVEIAKRDGNSIIVGDAPGVDAAVIAKCDELGVLVTVHGAFNKIRQRTKTGCNTTTSGSYTERDRLMARLADRCVGCWNGKSPSGTLSTMLAAKAFGKEVRVIKDV